MIRRTLLGVFAVALLALTATSAAAQDRNTDFPRFTAPVVDDAGAVPDDASEGSTQLFGITRIAPGTR